jgi:tetratricopeptide (TPR) repeat protein
MCFAHLGNFHEALVQIKAAKQFAGPERDLMLQIDVSEAATHVLAADYQAACAIYKHIDATYSDLLAEDHDSAQEFQERFGYALFHGERYRDAVRVFQQLLNSKSTQDEQRLRLYLGAALATSGDLREGRRELELAAKGTDPKLSQDALNWLTSVGRAH